MVWVGSIVVLLELYEVFNGLWDWDCDHESHVLVRSYRWSYYFEECMQK
jgi:hypothetical protein